MGRRQRGRSKDADPASRPGDDRASAVPHGGERRRPAGLGRAARPRDRRAGSGAAGRRDRHQAPGERHLPPGQLDDRRELLHGGHRARPVRAHRRAHWLQALHAPRREARGRQDRDDRPEPAGGRARRGAHRDGRVADRRHHLEGGRRPHQRPRARRPALDQPQLHRVHRPAAGRHPEHLDGVVRLGLGERQRPGRAQQQLPARRRQQQRRRDRPARRHPGHGRRSRRSRSSRC